MFDENIPYEEKKPTQNTSIARKNWDMAKGLQQVDGLTTSEYMDGLIQDNLDNKITVPTMQEQIETYYTENKRQGLYENRQAEADLVTARLYEYLDTGGFTFSPVTLKGMHKHLFTEILPSDAAGVFRTSVITKKEPVLNCLDTVMYTDPDSIEETLRYDFSEEKKFRYRSPLTQDQIHHIADFTSGIWQIHPFYEGNTRTTALFIVKYLNSKGIELRNDIFKNSSVYFRDSLVLANYENVGQDIHASNRYLYMFFEAALGYQSHDIEKIDLRNL